MGAIQAADEVVQSVGSDPAAAADADAGQAAFTQQPEQRGATDAEGLCRLLGRQQQPDRPSLL